MQILEIGNNFFTKGLQIHSSFYHVCFLYFVNLKNQILMSICSNLIKFKFKYIKRSGFDKCFHQTS
jgi:hypothetical protein